MTEYWKSNPKKWCRDCKKFIDAKPSNVQRHERGEKHLYNARRRLWEMRKEREKQASKQTDLEKELARIEAAAADALAVDVAVGDAVDHSTSSSSSSSSSSSRIPHRTDEDGLYSGHRPPSDESESSSTQDVDKPPDSGKPPAKKPPLSAPPGIAPPPGMSAAVEAQWLYKDDVDKVQGPWRLDLMVGWYERGHFSPKTPVMRIAPFKSAWKPINEWPQITGNVSGSKIVDAKSVEKDSKQSKMRDDDDDDSPKKESKKRKREDGEEDTGSDGESSPKSAKKEDGEKSSDDSEGVKGEEDASAAADEPPVLGGWSTVSVSERAVPVSSFQKRIDKEKARRLAAGLSASDPNGGDTKPIKTEAASTTSDAVGKTSKAPSWSRKNRSAIAQTDEFLPGTSMDDDDNSDTEAERRVISSADPLQGVSKGFGYKGSLLSNHANALAAEAEQLALGEDLLGDDIKIKPDALSNIKKKKKKKVRKGNIRKKPSTIKR